MQSPYMQAFLLFVRVLIGLVAMVYELLYPRGGGVLGFSFAGYVPLASQSLYPIIVYFVASYRPHLSHFLGKCNFRNPN